MGIFEKIFGTYSDKEIKRVLPIVDKIEELDETMQKLTDDELKAKTEEFKNRLQNGETLDDILPEAFAVVREASFRVSGKKPFRVQLMGGIILHQGRISEMRTGEGKTLTATLPSYLNALEGKGVHVVTVNDYLARIQAEEMGQIHSFLGLSVGVILNEMENDARREAYNCDITYATNNELGFDYLRDNMVVYKEQLVQRDLHYAIIDEVDSILIDEARTPLIISGSGSKSTQLYKIADTFVRTLKKGRIVDEDEQIPSMMRTEIKEEGDFVYVEKEKAVSLTEQGVKKAERFFAVDNLSDPENMEILHHINNALRAHETMHLDKDYVIQNQEIVIVDEFTGRLMAGRRYSDGLHQAIEAKENVVVNRESKTLATITFQNFFNKYTKKSGMTGTALTEENEFRHIYGMDVVVVPTNMPVVRIDHGDMVYRTEAGKFNAVVEDIVASHEKGQPVLVGTITIDRSEHISAMLKKRGIKHEVLNAKYHEKEAEIVTIATNMAGRGTDIKLEDGVQELGGLKIIGTERHESRRIDNQLRGRSGRQGDPGESRFYISMEDDLLRLFGSDKMMKVVDTLGMPEDEPIQHGMLSKAIENAQKKVEGNNFSVRKQLLDYDQVMNEQRELIYGERKKVLFGADISDSIKTMIKDVVEKSVDIYAGENQYPEDWDIKGLNEHIIKLIPIKPIELSEQDKEELTKDLFKAKIVEEATELYAQKEQEIGSESMREIERVIMLRVIDQKWMDHIDDMDQMRQGIGLRAYAQRDPLVEYKFIGFDMFEEMTNNIQLDMVRVLYNVRVANQPEREQVAQPISTNKDEQGPKQPVQRKEDKVGRNDLCPCGSGKKYKYCCGKESK
jgi:preprotein translocase subunit SecA